MYFEDYIEYINKVLYKLKGKKNIVVWGAGETAVKLFQHTQLINYNISHIVDKNKAGIDFFGKRIQLPNEINWQEIDVVIIAAVKNVANEIRKELRENQYYKNEILDWEKEEAYKPFYCYISEKDVSVTDDFAGILSCNERFHNIHKNQRLFILCNGPSVKKMDLKKLHGEISMAVSNFYMHQDYKIISPKYYCLAQFEYTDIFTEEIAKNWLKEINNRAGTVQFFVNTTEKAIIEENNIIPPERMNYVQCGNLNNNYDEVDLTKRIMSVQSVPIMCLQIAIYMGFKEVYLIGVDHSGILDNKYDYFYERKDNILGYTDYSTDKDGNINLSTDMKLAIGNRLMGQYKMMKNIAERSGTKIYNATIGGILEVFERVDYDNLF